MLYFRQNLEISLTSWIVSTPKTVSLSLRDKTWTCETECHHALEEYDKDLRVVHELEKKLCISIRWVPGCEDWERTGKMVAMCHEQCFVCSQVLLDSRGDRRSVVHSLIGCCAKGGPRCWLQLVHCAYLWSGVRVFRGLRAKVRG